KVLESVLADDEVERRPRPEVDDGALRPAVGPAQVGTELHALVARLWKLPGDHLAPQAEAAADVEHRAHRLAEVAQVGADEVPEQRHLLAVFLPRPALAVEAVVVPRVEAEAALRRSSVHRR